MSQVIMNTEVTSVIKDIIERHRNATGGCTTGEQAYNEVGKMSNVDPNEASWKVGDVFTVPKDVKAALFVARINGNKAPGVAVNTATGEGKSLYFSTLKKSVMKYEETGEGTFVLMKDEDGNNLPAVTADSSTKNPDGYNIVRKIVMAKPTIQSIADYVAGRSFKVIDVIENIPTSRLEKQVNDLTGQVKWNVVGIRKTNIPVFEDITPTDVVEVSE